MDSSTAETGSMVFHQEGKKPSIVNVLKERRIGEGSFGRTYVADVLIGRHNRRFIIKKFKGDTQTAEKNAARAIENYRLARDAGLKVFTTYRLADDKTSILMTNASIDSTICIGSDSFSHLPSFGEDKIQNLEMDKFQTLLDGVYNQALIAASHDLVIHPDSFFFLFNKESGSLDFVLGDLDLIHKKPRSSFSYLLLVNLDYAEMAISAFVRGNVENPDNYQAFNREESNRIQAAQGI
jgi:hypothetical protein